MVCVCGSGSWWLEVVLSSFASHRHTFLSSSYQPHALKILYLGALFSPLLLLSNFRITKGEITNNKSDDKRGEGNVVGGMK